ncbi:MAG TPA: hypothetical protein ENN23_02905 [Deltaproteobacteria bacterium]|nr:hypothetical protein [Deltaproteobacteria bacterium]
MFEPETVILILAAFGIGVTGLTEMAKRLLHAEGVAAYIISAVISAGATAYTLATTGAFTWVAFVVYSFVVFLEANGIYKFVKK